MSSPHTGAHRMPQQLWPADMYTPPTPGTTPIAGCASGRQGRMQAWETSGSRSAHPAIPLKLRLAASTLLGSGPTRLADSHAVPPSPEAVPRHVVGAPQPAHVETAVWSGVQL
eukprot:CAMPEP_0173375766 /NCGR_PEP_ID=MMETSP1144-20121109/29812_1 /TAXON_ID=483371 /ORGANISM="non described non described, Strain CCMP2298" /LENGTH=112 /DNA_ID=CAMNT_0014328241 /DNA_START=53 /DNA_END=391 /DNA_ORIENTATION=-